jgi:methionine synthase II (cobalamin-independent)
VFACLAVDYPRSPLPAQVDRVRDAEEALANGTIDDAALDAVLDDAVREVVAEQEIAGLTLIADGNVRWRDAVLPLIGGLRGLSQGDRGPSLEPGLQTTRPRVTGAIAWRAPIFATAHEFLAHVTELPIKQVLLGPYTLGLLTGLHGRRRVTATLALAEALNAELHSLVAAGCLMIQIEEDGATRVGDAEVERALFRDAHRRLVAGLEDPHLVHLSLGICGGSAAATGAAVLFDRPYSSYFFDLVRGPANWELILEAPFDRGIVCGVVDTRSADIDEPEAIVYAIAYAAAANGRGSTRVGVAPSGSLRGVDRHTARRKIERLANAVMVASAGPVGEVAIALEPDPINTRRYPALRRLAVAHAAAQSARRGAV